MEKSSSDPNQEFNMKEWGIKARITCENEKPRRFSASNLKSFREDERSFRSNNNISSTASSPGYTIKEEIDPSTYSFTTALKSLQAKTMYSWEYLSSDGITLNSKWNNAEKYICNPLSGEVPLECLSAKTLSQRSFHSRFTMSAPLIYPSHLHQFQANSPIIEHENEVKFTIKEKKRNTTRDIGVQSTPPDLSSGSPTPTTTSSIEERSRKLHCKKESGDSSVSCGKQKPEVEEEVREGKNMDPERETKEKKKVTMMMVMCRWSRGRGCLSLKGLWQREKCKSRKNNNNNPTSSPTFLYYINACYNE